jgi:hypothetical protein
MNFIKKLFGGSGLAYTPKITVEKVQQLFEYGKQKNLIGTGSSDFPGKPGQLIGWEAEGYYYKGYKNIPAQDVPAHIKWSANPVFAFVALVNDQIQYHYGENGESAVFICPVTTNPKHLMLIDDIFDHYYQKFGLPASLHQKVVVKPSFDKSDKMEFLKTYLEAADEDFFYDNFYEDIDHITMWVDWREEDDNIIHYCENIIQSEQLSVATTDAENERGFETTITYKGHETIIPYKGLGADRDTTIQTLNAVIGPDYEIRLFKESLGNDTLAFLPLSNSQWTELDKKYPQQVEARFLRITNQTELFG